MKPNNILRLGDTTPLMDGMEKVYNAVKVTMGCKGRNVIIEYNHKNTGGATITKDGVTVASAVSLNDPLENLGAQLMIDSARKVVSEVGDATTSCCVLTYNLIKEASKLIRDGEHPIDISKSLKNVTADIVEQIKEYSVYTVDTKEDLINIATIAANNDEYLGNLIGEAYDKVTIHGLINIEPSNTDHTYCSIQEGAYFHCGFWHRGFVNRPKTGAVELNNPLILIADKPVNSILEIRQFIEYAVSWSRPIIVIASEVSNTALGSAFNTIGSEHPIVFIRPPSFGDERADVLTDLAMYTNGYYIKHSEDTMFSIYSPELVLGQCTKAIIKENSFVIINDGDKDEDFDMYVAELVEKSKYLEEVYDIQSMQKRIASLQGGIGTLYIGGRTPVEVLEKVHRAEDAVKATQQAKLHGFIIGGGYLLDSIADEIKEKKLHEKDLGAKILEKVLRMPTKTILENAGYDYRYVKEMMQPEKNLYLNVNTGEYVDLIKDGVIDPASVILTSLTTSVSVASTVLLTENIIINDEMPRLKMPTQ